MTDDYQDIDLASLSDDELVEQMHNDLYDGMKDEIVQGTNILLERGQQLRVGQGPRREPFERALEVALDGGRGPEGQQHLAR